MIMKIIAKLTIATIAAAAAMAFNVRAGHADSNAPWCAVFEMSGDIYWNCQYRTFAECLPNVTGGTRGFCSVNPSGPGRNAPVVAGMPRYHTRHVAKY